MLSLAPHQIYDELLACASAGLTPLITSSPGVGKSSLVQKFAKDYKLKLIDFRLSQCTPEDLQGFPMRNGNKATFTPFDVFPLEGEPIPEGYQGWLLFLDEMTSASKPVQAAAYKLILDRMVGSFHLHPAVMIAAAGNKMTDKAVVTQMSTALQSRLIHYEMEVSQRDFVKWATEAKLDHRIISFVSFMPSRLMDFKPDHHDRTFACPRTWEFLSRLIKDQEISNKILARVAGTIGEGAAIEFLTFAEEFNNLPSIQDIIKDPETYQIPSKMSTKYATMSMLVEHLNEKTIDPIITYVSRFDIELQILFMLGANESDKKLRHENASFAKYLVKMVRYLN